MSSTSGFLPVAQDEEQANQTEVLEEESTVAARSIHRVSDIQTKLKPKFTTAGIVAGLGAAALMAVAAVVSMRNGSAYEKVGEIVMLQQEGKDCEDLDPSCPYRAGAGDCDFEWTAEYMNFACRATCGTCAKAKAFIPKIYKIDIPALPIPTPENYQVCVIQKGVCMESLQCPQHVTEGNVLSGNIKKGKFVVEMYHDSENSTAICVKADPDASIGWNSAFSFACQSKAIYVNVGTGPVFPNYNGKFRTCVVPPLFPTQCPLTVDRSNRIPEGGEPDQFKISVHPDNGEVCATSDEDWRFNLAFFCQVGELTPPSNTVRVEFGDGETWKESCTKCIRPPSPATCPAIVSDINWATNELAPDRFSITSRPTGEICATRVDSIGQCDESLSYFEPSMWDFDLAVYCKGEPIKCSCINPAEYNTFACTGEVERTDCGTSFACSKGPSTSWLYHERFSNGACTPVPDREEQKKEKMQKE